MGVGYREDQQWAKKSTPPVRGDFEKPLELYCISTFLQQVSQNRVLNRTLMLAKIAWSSKSVNLTLRSWAGVGIGVNKTLDQ